MTSTKQTRPRVFAIVPAAGQSRRMGRAKQLLDCGGRPMLFAVLEPLTAADVAGVALVTNRSIVERIDVIETGGPSRQTLVGSAGPGLQTWAGESERETFIVYNDDPSSEMIDSVRIGLAAWDERESIDRQDGFLVCPGDHPGIPTKDLNQCIRAFIDTPGRIVIATRGGRCGHPIIVPADLTTFVESSACDGGLNALRHAFPDRVVHVATVSEAVIRDVDTPDDYEALS
ncbi:MAG: nucleotidyltransferase family protein [Planctomycetes bacterium]|nr:nucleotidyltransferase family protein [Planctomycetota bacterium]